MNQPDLGLKVTELRLQKNMTQEQLAEKCEISTRTIQRIESGEVYPRSHTLRSLSDALDFYFGADQTSGENGWLAILHLSGMVCIFLIPLVIWLWKRPQSYKIDKQGREVINFQVTMTLVMFVGLVMLVISVPVLFMIAGRTGIDPGFGIGLSEVMFLCAPSPLILVIIFSAIQGVINAMRSLSDRPTHYPLTIPFVK